MTSVKQTGQASIQFTEPIYIESAASITGKKEGEGPLGHLFDMVSQDPLFGTKTWEEAVSYTHLDVYKRQLFRRMR